MFRMSDWSGACVAVYGCGSIHTSFSEQKKHNDCAGSPVVNLRGTERSRKHLYSPDRYSKSDPIVRSGDKSRLPGWVEACVHSIEATSVSFFRWLTRPRMFLRSHSSA